MKLKLGIGLLMFHIALLLLAATNFTAIGWLHGHWTCSFQFFAYSYSNGWGYVYQSDYSGLCVLTYIAAYAIGLAAYCSQFGRLRAGWTSLAIFLCVIGLGSFLIEGSHWVTDHCLSLIGHAPIVSLPLALGLLLQLLRSRPVCGTVSSASTLVKG